MVVAMLLNHGARSCWLFCLQGSLAGLDAHRVATLPAAAQIMVNALHLQPQKGWVAGDAGESVLAGKVLCPGHLSHMLHPSGHCS